MTHTASHQEDNNPFGLSGPPPAPEEEDRSNPYIGVDAGYAYERPRYTSPPSGYDVQLTDDRPDLLSTPVRVAPRYTKGQEWTMFRGLAPEVRVRIQDALAQAGYLDPEQITGLWGPDSADAIHEVLAFANQAGLSWDTALSELVAINQIAVAQGLEPEKPRIFVAPAYVAPDYDTLAQVVRREVASYIGREPEDWEMTVLADKLSGLHRADYDVQVATQRAQFDAEGRALEVAATQDGGVVEESAGEIQGVDPIASIQEEIHRRYAPEAERVQRVAETARSREGLMASILGIDRMVS